MSVERPPIARKPGFFYGYWIVVATFFCLFIFGGVGFFAFSLFVKPLQADLGWGRGEIMAAFTILYLVIGITGLAIGRVIARYEVRKVIAIGALIVGLGFALLSLTNSLWHFYLGYTVIGVGMATMGHIPSSAVVSNWFKKRRGIAIGIMSTGIGAGGLVLSPLIGGYFIPNFGWRVSYLAVAVLSWVLIIPLALLVIKTSPANMGLYPDGEEKPEAVVLTETASVADKGLTLKETIATSGFWLIAISFLAGSFSQCGALQSQVPHLQDIGFPAATAAGALGIVGIGSIVGKIGFGWLCDRIPAKYGWAIGVAFQVTAITILMNIKLTSPLAVTWLYAIMIGLAAGSWLPTMSMTVSTNFGLTAYGTIFGAIAFAQAIGVATGPLLAGYIYDMTSTYHWAFIIFLALCAVAIVTVLSVRRPKSLEHFNRG